MWPHSPLQLLVFVLQMQQLVPVGSIRHDCGHNTNHLQCRSVRLKLCNALAMFERWLFKLIADTELTSTGRRSGGVKVACALSRETCHTCYLLLLLLQIRSFTRGACGRSAQFSTGAAGAIDAPAAPAAIVHGAKGSSTAPQELYCREKEY